MHELGIAKELFEVVKKHARDNSLQKVTKIVIKIGVASGIEQGHLRHSFVDHILPGSVADEALLEFDLEPIKVKCKKCGEVITKEQFDSSCPRCKSPQIELVSGKQVYVECIEGY